MDDQRPKRAPLGFSKLLDSALSGYRARAPFYLLAALAAFAFELLAMPFSGYEATDSKALIGLLVNSLADSMLVALVCIGVARDAGAEETSVPSILSTALERLWAVFVVMLVVQVIEVYLLPAVTTLEGSFYGILIAPAALFFGALQSAVVIAAIDPDPKSGLIVAKSLGRSFFLSLSGGNIGRTVLLGLVVLAPILLESVLGDVMHARHVANANFWASIPIDAIVTGPIAALVTVFYLDVLERATP